MSNPVSEEEELSIIENEPKVTTTTNPEDDEHLSILCPVCRELCLFPISAFRCDHVVCVYCYFHIPRGPPFSYEEGGGGANGHASFYGQEPLEKCPECRAKYRGAVKRNTNKEKEIISEISYEEYVDGINETLEHFLGHIDFIDFDRRMVIRETRKREKDFSEKVERENRLAYQKSLDDLSQKFSYQKTMVEYKHVARFIGLFAVLLIPLYCFLISPGAIYTLILFVIIFVCICAVLFDRYLDGYHGLPEIHDQMCGFKTKLGNAKLSQKLEESFNHWFRKSPEHRDNGNNNNENSDDDNNNRENNNTNNNDDDEMFEYNTRMRYIYPEEIRMYSRIVPSSQTDYYVNRNNNGMVRHSIPEQMEERPLYLDPRCQPIMAQMENLEHEFSHLPPLARRRAQKARMYELNAQIQGYLDNTYKERAFIDRDEEEESGNLESNSNYPVSE